MDIHLGLSNKVKFEQSESISGALSLKTVMLSLSNVLQDLREN